MAKSPKSFNEGFKTFVTSSSLPITPLPFEEVLKLDETSYFKAFMMLELLLYPTKHPTTTHTLDLKYKLILLIFEDEFSMVAITRIGG